MFTGIIKELTQVGSIVNKKEHLVIGIKSKFAPKAKLGDSISIDGVCLTVAEKNKDLLFFEIAPTTKAITIIKTYAKNTWINLEPAVTLNDSLDGHLVQGHVDGKVILKSKVKKDKFYLFNFTVPKDLAKYIVQKGSVAINGISLTVVDIKKLDFTIAIIPFTLKNTNLQYVEAGDELNLETDIIARYVERLTSFRLKL